MNQRVVVAGASGRLGRLVLEQLIQAGIGHIVATTRSPENLTSFSSRGVEVRRADFNANESLIQAFAGGDRMLLISTDDLASGQRARQHRNAIEAAAHAGVRHILYTSMPAPVESKAIPFAPDHVETEQALQKSGVGYTSLRVAWYAENPLDLGFLTAAVQSGTWLTSAGGGRIAYIPRLDVARAAAAALVNTAATNGIVNITGVQAQTAEELAASLSRVSGKKIRVRHVDDETLRRELIANGITETLVPMQVVTDANTRGGHFDLVTTAVQDLTGAPPATFEQFLQANKKQLTR